MPPATTPNKREQLYTLNTPARLSVRATEVFRSD